MEPAGFQYVCAECLEARGVLDSADLPSRCPACGRSDPWTGPVASPRFKRGDAEHLVDSPFYVAAHSPGKRAGS